MLSLFLKERIYLFLKKIDLRNIQLKECSTAICVVCCLSSFIERQGESFDKNGTYQEILFKGEKK